jgi:hypothetical protein
MESDIQPYYLDCFTELKADFDEAYEATRNGIADDGHLFCIREMHALVVWQRNRIRELEGK